MYSDLADYEFAPSAKLPRFKEKHPILEIDLQEDDDDDEEIFPIFICPSESSEAESGG